MNKIVIATIAAVMITTFSQAAPAADQSVGKVVAVRGAATIERAGLVSAARINSSIEASDAFRTAAASRAKLLFIDDSVLTLGENTRMSIREFIYAKGKEGKSVFNLLDGKMRSVVGKTRFEVQTPTAVAAARGTVIHFEVGKTAQRYYSKILCLEGKVDVRSAVPTVLGTVTLTPGTMVVVTANQPPPLPVPAPPSELNNAQSTASGSGGSDTSSDAGSEPTSSASSPTEDPSPPPATSGPPVTSSPEGSGGTAPLEKVASGLPSFVSTDMPAPPGLRERPPGPPGAGGGVPGSGSPVPFVPPVTLPPPQPAKVNIRINTP